MIREGESKGRAAAIDALCLAAITIASALPYLTKIGFYSDDWALLADFAAARRTGDWSEMVLLFTPRPVQGLYLALLFELFGFAPLGYHIVNTAVLAVSACLLYRLLLRLAFGRTLSFAAALLFIMLPQLSTVRVWYAALQIPLSMALMLASLHWQLSFARSGRFGWLAAALVAALLSIFAYEIFAPLIAGFAAALLFIGWRSGRATGSEKRLAVAITAISLAGMILLAIAYKVLLSGRAGEVADPERYVLGLYQLVRPDYDWRVDSSLNVFAAARAELWAPVKGWFTGAASLAEGRTPLLVVAIALLTAGLSWWRLSTASRDGPPATGTRLLMLGIAAFILGHAVFLVVPWITFSSTGIDNRMHVAAAIGVAMIFASALAWVVRAVPRKRQSAALAATLAAVSALAFVRLAQIERYWAEAPALQQRVLEAARSDLQALPPNSTVILDGICPYHGPAVVFETDWDVRGALTLALGRPISGDVVSKRMKVTEEGLETSMYEEPRFYGFGDSLYIYHSVKHELIRLSDVRAAQAYFRTREPTQCRVSFLGRGVAV